MLVVAIQIIIALATFHVLHELGHVLCAKLLKFRIIKIGFALKPIPHTFVHVSINNSKVNNLKRKIYYLSGFFVYISLLVLFVASSKYQSWVLLQYESLVYAFYIQFMIETNPFYSDFVLLQLDNDIQNKLKAAKYRISLKAVHKQSFSLHQFSKNWYIHLILWTITILLIYKHLLQ
jgi:hypothetical protein